MPDEPNPNIPPVTTPTAPDPQIIEFEDPDSGETWRGTPEEVATKLFEAKKHANEVIRSEREEKEFLRQTIDTYGIGDKDKKPPEQQFDKNKFFTELAADPERAMRSMVGRILGTDDPATITSAVQSMQEDLKNQKEAAFVARFYNRVGIEEDLGPETASMIVRRMQQDGLPPDDNGMELAYHRLQREGKLGGNRDQGSGRPRPPARLEGSGDRGKREYTQEEAEKMDLETLRKLAGIGS